MITKMKRESETWRDETSSKIGNEKRKTKLRRGGRGGGGAKREMLFYFLMCLFESGL